MPLRADRMDAFTRERRSLWRTPRAAGPFVCVAAIAVAGSVIAFGQAAAVSAQAWAVRYVANAGILLETDGRAVLIDGLVRQGIPPYAIPDSTARRQLEKAEPPFSNVSVVLVTHWHEDHFSPDAVAAHLGSNPRAVLVSSREVVDRVRAVDTRLPPDRFRAVTPPPGSSERIVVDGLPVHVLRIRHNPARRLPQEHVGFLIEACRTVLHVGDADPAADNFALLRRLPRIDVGLLPYWYMLSANNRAFVKESIGPGSVIGMHLPPEEAADVRRRIPTDVELLVKPGTVVDLCS